MRDSPNQVGEAGDLEAVLREVRKKRAAEAEARIAVLRERGVRFPADVEVTSDMIEAGLKAYRAHASHDEMSFFTPDQTVEAILKAALAVQG